MLLWHDREAVAVPIRHMILPRLNKHPEYRLGSDAGPEGIGAVVFNRDGTMLASLHKLSLAMGSGQQE